MRFTDSASRHGIVEYSYANEIELVSNPDAVGLLFVGDDHRGTPLEIIDVIV